MDTHAEKLMLAAARALGAGGGTAARADGAGSARSGTWA